MDCIDGSTMGLDHIFKAICDKASVMNIDKIVLFGSRARGDNKPKSDIDLAVYGRLDNYERAVLSSFIKEDLPTLLCFDVVFVDENTSLELIRNINRDGVSIYEKN